MEPSPLGGHEAAGRSKQSGLARRLPPVMLTATQRSIAAASFAWELQAP